MHDATEQPWWTDQHGQAYKALSTASARMGRAGYAAQLRDHLRHGRKRSTCRYAVTEGHQDVVDMMAALCHGRAGPEEAMHLLWRGDIMAQRTVAT